MVFSGQVDMMITWALGICKVNEKNVLHPSKGEAGGVREQLGKDKTEAGKGAPEGQGQSL